MAKVHEYEGKDITVTYDVERCIHAAECVRGLPAVFNPDNRPWIDPDAASADEVVEAVGRCPTGALQYLRDHGSGAGEPAVETAAAGAAAAEVGATNDASPADCATIDVSSNGPLLIAGKIMLGLSSGAEPLKMTSVALCRCGHSSNKPYCDGSHAATGFVAD